jgi:uncharacterized membrane protein
VTRRSSRGAAEANSRAAAIVEPGREDPVVAASVGGIGGPVGRWARVGATWWTPVRVVVAMGAFAYILGYVLDLSCRSDLWKSPERYEHLCYSDIAPLYSLRGFADGVLPYLQSGSGHEYLEYPVLTGAFMQLAAMGTTVMNSLLGGIDRVQMFFDVNVVLLFIPMIITVIATALTVRRRPWDGAMVALAPTMILAATVNWDLLPLAFAGVGLLLWSRSHPLAAGILIGLAISAKFYPLVFLFGFLLLTIRTAKWKAFALLIVGTVASWAVVNVPVALMNFDGWWRFYDFSRTRGVDFGSIWYGLTEAGLSGVPADQLNNAATGSFVVLCVAIGWLVLWAPRRPRLAAVLFLVVAAFVLTNKVYSPQYSLWLVPLAVMARPRWRDFLIWQVGEVIYFMAIWWFLVAYGIEDTTGLTGQQYALAILIHVLVTVYFAGMVVQDILVPSGDPVRADGFADDRDDPGGGVFDQAPDRFTLRRSTTAESLQAEDHVEA